jgi:hypothetical protein
MMGKDSRAILRRWLLDLQEQVRNIANSNSNGSLIKQKQKTVLYLLYIYRMVALWREYETPVTASAGAPACVGAPGPLA